MAKLRLELDELKVESFATDAEVTGGGTVHGHVTNFLTHCPPDAVPGPKLTVAHTCPKTCGLTCNTCYATCDASCNGTCLGSCACPTHDFTCHTCVVGQCGIDHGPPQYSGTPDC